MSNSSIWPIDQTLSGATTPGQSGPGSDDNEGVLIILQNSSIAGASLSVCLVSLSGHLWGEFYSYVKMQSVYSTVPANWTSAIFKKCDAYPMFQGLDDYITNTY